MPDTTTPLTPSQLNALTRDLLEGAFPAVLVEGEISNLARPASGHLYFSLKDARAQVRCALFKPKSSWLRFRPENGMQVHARGRVTLYEPRGDYQLILDTLEEAGEGALRRAFEELKARLQAEGLFEAGRKRPLPRYLRRLAVVTSPSGAAIRDVLQVLARRWPLLEVDVLPAQVQGATAAAEVRDRLQWAGASGRYDAVLLTRGGGSLEDLFAFNDEALARAIVACPVPVVSAIGHEVDTSISDFVADLRAPTPSAAAELLVPDRTQMAAVLRELRGRAERVFARGQATRAQRLDHALARLRSASPGARLRRARERLAELGQRMQRTVARQQRLRGERLASLARRLAAQHPARRLARQRELLSSAGRRLQPAIERTIRVRRERSASLGRALHALSPLATLDRGYAILRDPESGAVVRRAAEAADGQRLEARMADGVLPVRVERAKRD